MNMRSRLNDIEEVLADPPRVHKNETGSWSTARSAYEFLAETLPESDAVTLETGLGVSTVLFAMWQTNHTCVVWNQSEADAVQSYLHDRGVGTSRVTFLVGSSTDVLPAWQPAQSVDLYLIDGGHFFPVPIIDFFYGVRHLRPGGTVIVDDYNLPSVRLGLDDYLERSPSWTATRRTLKWRAFVKAGEESVGIDDQPFLKQRRPDALLAQRLVPAKLRPTVERLARSTGIY